MTSKSKSIFFLFITFLVILFQRCTVRNPVENNNQIPVLSVFTIPDTLYLQSDTLFSVSVEVADPQGLDNIVLVRTTISSLAKANVLQVDTLRDDGINGDIIPLDGVFFGNLEMTFAAEQSGEFPIIAEAVDQQQHTAQTSKTLHVVNRERNDAPELSNPFVPDTLSEATLNDVFFSVTISDPQGLTDIDSVIFEIYPPFQASPLLTNPLFNDGTHGDVTIGDGIFSFKGNFLDTLKSRGIHHIRFVATDLRGSKGSLVESFYLNLMNLPPVLSQISAPDTVSRSTSSPFLISVHADDPQGLNDIQTVYFNTTKPDGSPSSGNPFALFDDGSNGDLVAGDGIYSLTIQITPQNETGDYQFDFYAEDIWGAVSDPLTHIMTVVD